MAPFVSDELPATPPWWFLERKSALRTIARSPSMVVNNRSVFFSLLWASFPPKAEVESRVEPNVVCQLLNVESRQNVGEVRTQLLPVKVGNVVLVCNGRLATFPFFSFKVASSNLFARAKAGDWMLIFRSRRFNSRCTAPRAER